MGRVCARGSPLKRELGKLSCVTPYFTGSLPVRRCGIEDSAQLCQGFPGRRPPVDGAWVGGVPPAAEAQITHHGSAE